jgi:hypothetical protein
MIQSSPDSDYVASYIVCFCLFWLEKERKLAIFGTIFVSISAPWVKTGIIWFNSLFLNQGQELKQGWLFCRESFDVTAINSVTIMVWPFNQNAIFCLIEENTVYLFNSACLPVDSDGPTGECVVV